MLLKIITRDWEHHKERQFIWTYDLSLESPSLHGHICQPPHLDGVIWFGTNEGETGPKCVETSKTKWICIASEGGAFTSFPSIPPRCLVQNLSIPSRWMPEHVATNLTKTMPCSCPQTLAYYLLCSQYHSSTRSNHMAYMTLCFLSL